jgi:FkbH-like protein
MSLKHILDYPYDSSLIFRKLKGLNLELSQMTPKQKTKIAFLSGSTTSHIKNFLNLFLMKKRIQADFWESEYNQYFSDAVMGNRSLYDFKPQIIILYQSVRNITHFPSPGDPSEKVQEQISSEIFKIQQIIEGIKKNYQCTIIINNFEYLNFRTLGNLDGSNSCGKTAFIRELNNSLNRLINQWPGVYLNDQNYLSSLVGLDHWHDSSWWCLYKYSSSLASFPYIAESLSAVIQSILGLSKKNLILDLDNTLWGGVIGDDGVNGIQLGPDTAEGESYLDFQTYCLSLKERGVILSVCSKNELSNALAGLSKDDSQLKPNSFSSIKANWDRKDLNIFSMSQELNLGLDSFVFIDDNPTERQIVQQNLPDVSVPDVGSDVTNFKKYIDRNYYFEPISISTDDLNRSQMYEESKVRKNLEQQFTNYDDYLASLELEAEIKPFQAEYLERITQLINKTNQFNLTTKRMTIEEVERNRSDNNVITIYARLKDKFGDNGLVSVLIADIRDKTAFVSLWLMSCRVLKKDLEKLMLDKLVEYSMDKKLFSIQGQYIPTLKNQMVESHYQNLGFNKIKEINGETYWLLDISNYKPLNKYIRIQNDS